MSLATGAVLRHIRRRNRRAHLPNESLLSQKVQIQTAIPEGTLSLQTVDTFALPQHEQALQLIDSFFSDTGLLFPYVHERYLRTRFNYVRQRGAQGMSSHFLALLNAVFAMAAHIHHVADAETQDSRNGLDAETFFVRARLLLGRSHRPTVERGESIMEARNGVAADSV